MVLFGFNPSYDHVNETGDRSHPPAAWTATQRESQDLGHKSALTHHQHKLSCKH